jgi:FkbM family methyltransferase
MTSPRLHSSTNVSFSKQVRTSLVALGIFLLGFAVGSYHGQTNTEPRSLGLLNVALPSSTSTDCEKTSPRIVENNQGWKSIEIFYGKTQDTDAKPKKWFSQVKQDQVVIGLLRNKREGFFIDLAANNARKLSNSYALERSFGWEGICIEPNPEYWFDLSRFRTCKIVAAVVGRDRMEEIKFNYRGVYGGITRDGFDNTKERESESIPAFTVPLQEVLERADTPRVVDYLSLDIEGAETYIMKNFPLSSYRIKIMTVERPDKELQQHLGANGFKLMGDMSSWGESLWIHNDFMNELDLSVLDGGVIKKAPQSVQS